MRRLVLTAAALAAVGIGGIAAPVGAQTLPLTVTDVDISEYPQVRMTLTAPPGLEGQLPADEFRVTENGEERDAKVVKLQGEALQVVLVIDSSGSMQGAPIEAAKGAALSFVSVLPDDSNLALVTFGDGPTVISGLTNDTSAVTTGISSLVATGETALYDGVLSALTVFEGAPTAHRELVLLSDGGDTRSANPLETVVAALQQSGVHVSVVELLTSESDHASLAQIASAGSGQVVSVDDPAALSGLYAGIARDLSNQYVVTYESEHSGSTTVAVSVEHDGVTAAASQQLELPTVAEPAPAPAGPQAERAPDAGVFEGEWMIVLGAIGIFVALAVVLMAFTGRPKPERRLADEYGLESESGMTVQRLADAGGRLTGAVQGMVDRAGGLVSVDRGLEEAGLSIRSGELMVAVVAATLLGVLFGYGIGGPVLSVLMAVTPTLLAYAVVTYLGRHRRNAFADQLGDTLLLLSSTLRAGYGLTQALDSVARESAEPTATEFARIVVETRLGRDADDAMAALAERMHNQDFVWVVQAIAVHRQSGGDLSDLLDRIGETVRNRARLFRQVRALSAEGRLSAIVLTALPFAMALMVSATNPDYLDPLFESTNGKVMIGVGLALMVTGGLWLRRIVKPEY